MSDIATTQAGTDTDATAEAEAPVFSNDYRYRDDGIVQTILQEIDDTADKLRKALVTSRNAYARIGQSFASLRENIVRANGDPDWNGRSDRYRYVVGNVLDKLTDGLEKSEARRERQTITAAISYHTRKAVRSRVVAIVQENNPDADAEALTKLQEKALAKLEQPASATRQSPTLPASDSPEDLAAADAASRTVVAALVEKAEGVSMTVRAETILRLASDFFVSAKEQNEKGIPGREQAQSFIDRAYVVVGGIGLLLAQKLDEKGAEKVEKALHLAVGNDDENS